MSEKHVRRRRRRRRRRSRPVWPGVLVMILLLGILGGAGFLGLRFRDQREAKLREGETLVAQARAEMEEARANNPIPDPDDPEYARRQEELRQQLLSQAREEEQALEEQTAALEQSLREAEDELSRLEQDEDYAYYKALYDTYEEGRVYVVGLLSGN